MCNKSKLEIITNKVVSAANECLKDRLDKVYLYGSYARGDYNNESDIDIMIIADIPREEARSVYKKIWSLIGNLDIEHEIIISIHVTDSKMYYQYINDLPFYMNVQREGIMLNA